MDPFLQLFRHTANLLLPPASAPQGADGKGLVGQLTLLLEIYYDFTCQDLPPAIEDGHEEFFGPEQGWFVRILSWEAGALGQEDDEEKAGVVSLLKTRVLEIAEVCSDLSYLSFPFKSLLCQWTLSLIRPFYLRFTFISFPTLLRMASYNELSAPRLLPCILCWHVHPT